jgi:hypothetical protein
VRTYSTYFSQLLAQRVFLVIEVVHIQSSDGPGVHLPEQRHTARCEHGTHQLDKLVVVQMVAAVYGLEDLDGGL